MSVEFRCGSESNACRHNVLNDDFVIQFNTLKKDLDELLAGGTGGGNSVSRKDFNALAAERDDLRKQLDAALGSNRANEAKLKEQHAIEIRRSPPHATT